jgi:Protein of unknown function (DUF3313)
MDGIWRLACAGALLLMTAGCATAPLDSAGSLASYDNLAPSDGILTHSRQSVRKDEVLAAKTVRIVPTVFSAATAKVELSAEQRKLIANAADRSLCIGLSDRFAVVAATEPADLTVHAVVTHLDTTNATIAGVSKAASVATSILVPVPVPKPRIPLGLGSLSIEAEARDPRGIQQAAIIWARGADSFTTAARVSSAGDAYDLASSFGADFSKMLVTGSDPFRTLPPLPSMQRIGSTLGAAPKYAACEAFGRGPGVVGLIGGGIGLPPEWTDKGAGDSPQAQAQTQAQAAPDSVATPRD